MLLLGSLVLLGLVFLGLALIHRAPRRRMVYVQNSRGDRRMTR